MNNAGIVVLKREGYCGYKTLKGAYIKEKQVLRFLRVCGHFLGLTRLHSLRLHDIPLGLASLVIA